MPPTKIYFKDRNRVFIATPDLLLETRLPDGIRVYSDDQAIT